MTTKQHWNVKDSCTFHTPFPDTQVEWIYVCTSLSPKAPQVIPAGSMVPDKDDLPQQSPYLKAPVPSDTAYPSFSLDVKPQGTYLPGRFFRFEGSPIIPAGPRFKKTRTEKLAAATIPLYFQINASTHEQPPFPLPCCRSKATDDPGSSDRRSHGFTLREDGSLSLCRKWDTCLGIRVERKARGERAILSTSENAT